MSNAYLQKVGGGGGGSFLSQFTFDDGTHTIVSSNNVNINNGAGITATANPDNSSSFIISVVNDGFPWSEKNSDFTAAIQNGYFCNALLTASLPASAGLTIGNTIIFFVDTASVVTIQAATGQLIQVGSTISSAGGTVSSNTQGATLELVFKPSDLTWHTISSLGSWSTT